TSATPLTAYFVQGHHEHSLEAYGDLGYHKFASALNENCISVKTNSLLGTIVLDCNVLVVAGTLDAMLESELEKIDKYLNQGGRALFLFNSASINRADGQEKTGLEKILAK